MAGLSGLLGALLFFSGDMLFYGYFGSGAGFPAGMLATVATDSSARLFVGGLLGMPLARSAPGYVGAVLLILLVVFGKTRYPKWTVLANPGILRLLSPFADATPAPVGAILVGGFTNLTIAGFFLVSVVTTWRLPPDS